MREGDGVIVDLDIDLFSDEEVGNSFPSYAELDDIFDADDSVEKAALFSLAQDTGSDVLLLESSDYDLDVFADFVEEAQNRGLGLQKHKVIDQANPDTIGQGKEYSMFLTRLKKIMGAINDTKKMNQMGTLLIEGLASVINSNAIQILHDRPIEHSSAETFPNWLAKTFAPMHIENNWDMDWVYEKTLEIFASERRRLNDSEKVRIKKELEILAQKTRIVINQEKGRSVYNRPVVGNIACFFSPDSLICECGGRSDVQFDFDIVPLTAMVVTTRKNKKHHVVVANPPYRCRDCGDFICLPEIFVDVVEQAIKEIIQDLKINFKGIAFYRPNLQELMQRLPSELSSLLKEEKGVILVDEYPTSLKGGGYNDYLGLYLTLIKRFVGEAKSYIDYVDFETFVASVVQTLETKSIFTLTYELYVFEDERRMNLEQTLIWMKNNLARIAGIQYFTKRRYLEEVLPPVLALLQKAYILRYLADYGNFKQPLSSMKIISRERPRVQIPFAALWDYYTYLQAIDSSDVGGLSILDYYWADEDELLLVKPMSHKYGYTDYKQLLLSGHVWKCFESEYFDSSKLEIHAELLSLIIQDREKFMEDYLYPLPSRVSPPYIEGDINLRLVAAHKIATLIESGDEAYIGEVCFQLRDTVSYMQLVDKVLEDTDFIEDSTPLRLENRGLFNELDYDSIQ